jgi:hypothetical protein
MTEPGCEATTTGLAGIGLSDSAISDIVPQAKKEGKMLAYKAKYKYNIAFLTSLCYIRDNVLKQKNE